MTQKPRLFSSTFFNWRELTTSIIQGLVITTGTLFIYRYAVQQGSNENITRTMVFLTLISANIFLTLVNRSFYYSIFTTGKYKNNLVPLIIIVTITITTLLMLIEPFQYLFQFENLTGWQIVLAISTGFLSVIWFEGAKYVKRRRSAEV
jgi:Ca2+-transporting ATPase